MAPTPTGTAFCMACPRVRNSRAVSAMREGAGRGQRGIFAERMAGDELRIALEIEAGFRFQHAHDGERDRHQRRLGVFGERERVGRAFEDDGAQLVAERVIDLLEHRRAGAKFVGQRLAHADRLAALARKHESDRHVLALSSPFLRRKSGRKTPRMGRVLSSCASRGNQATRLYRLKLSLIFREAGAMSDLVSDDDLARARSDPAFRQQLLAENLERLLEALNTMRRTDDASPEAARQMREGVDLAVKLADRLQQTRRQIRGPRAA